MQQPDSVFPRSWLLVCVVLGLAVRACLWLLAGDLELQSDEAGYLHLALQWHQLGFYPDSYRFLWPPGYPAYLLICIQVFGERALDAARLGQIAASASIGWTTGLLAWRLFGRRAAVIAGLGWALYLPLAAFTHLLWNETLFLAFFLPALYQLLVVVQRAPDAPGTARMLSAGLLLAAALYIKEAASFLVPAWVVLLALASRGGPSMEGLRRAALLGLTVAACVLPWGLRNKEVYGRFMPLGSSLGENAYNGLNATYRNFDLIPLEVERLRRGLPPLPTRVALTQPPAQAAGWERAEEFANLPARLSENTRRGLEFARAHPGWFLRTRIQKLCDGVVPTTFLTRNLALGNYQGQLGAGAWRSLAAWGSVAQVGLLLLLGGAGLLGSLPPGAARRLVWTTLGYFLATTLLVSMSRFRLPVVPLLLAGVGGLFHKLPAGLSARMRCALWGVVLVLAWWVNAPVLAQIWPMVTGQAQTP